MHKLKILNSREIKKIKEQLQEQFGYSELDYGFLMNEKGKIYLINKEIAQVDISQLRIDTYGMYFGEFKNEQIRLSIEGSQLIGPHATKNILEISKEQSRDWLRGRDLEIETELSAYVLVKSGKDFFGTGRLKEGKLLNFVPKSRRLKIED